MLPLFYLSRGVLGAQRFPSGGRRRFNSPSRCFWRLLSFFLFFFRARARIYPANLINSVQGATATGSDRSGVSRTRRVPPFHDLHSGSPWRKINCANRGSIRSIRLVLARQRIHPVINRLQLVENQKVSINGGLADLNSPSRGRPTANFVADQVFSYWYAG